MLISSSDVVSRKHNYDRGQGAYLVISKWVVWRPEFEVHSTHYLRYSWRRLSTDLRGGSLPLSLHRLQNLVDLIGLEPIWLSACKANPGALPEAQIWWFSEVSSLLSDLLPVFRRRFYRPVAGTRTIKN